MKSTRKNENVFVNGFVFLMLLTAVGLAAAQHKETPSVSVPTPHVSTPAERPSIEHSSSTHTTTGRTMGTQRNSASGKSGTSSGGRNTNVSRNANVHAGKMSSATMGKGASGSVASSMSRPAPGRQIFLKGGGTASIRPNGQIRSINQNGMQISHSLNGSRTVVSTRNGARIVSTGTNSGYVQRPYVVRNGQTYVSRTVIVNNVTYTTVYRSYSYRGYCCYYAYQPAYYYTPVYYGWAYNPWPAPVYYGWGWGGAPWYGYYGGYFAPYPVYPSAAFWLTDYLIAANLQAAYMAQGQANAAAANAAPANAAAANNTPPPQPQTNAGNDASAGNSGTVTLTPEVKAAIAEEVKAQLAAEQAAAQPASQSAPQPSPAAEQVPPALDPAHRTFVVANDLAVIGSDGQECELSQGDVLTRLTDTPDANRQVNVSVSASKKNDCTAGKQVAVSVDALQEMHNHFEKQVDSGMKELSAKQGTSGLPKAPDTATVPSEVPPPSPDTTAAKALQDQQTAADQTEAQVVKEAFSQGS